MKRFLQAQTLTEEQYLEIEEYFLTHNPNRQEISALRHRIDSRTIPEFVQYIKKQTDKEQFLINVFKTEYESMNHKVVIEDNGMDNLGSFIGSREKVSQRSDFLIDIDGAGMKPYEVKHNPIAGKCTFKESNLKSYIKEDARIILFYGVGDFQPNGRNFRWNTAYWAFLNVECIEKMLTLPIIVYREMGYKPGVQILQKDYHKYFNSYKVKCQK